MSGTRFLAAALAAAVLGAAQAAQAGPMLREPTSEIDPEVFKIQETKYLGVRPDRALSFLDDQGRPFALGDLARDKPLVLVLSYYMCDGTCSVVNADLLNLLSKVKAYRIGRDFRVLTVTFDENDTLDTLSAFRKSLPLPEEWRPAWTFALPAAPGEARKLADAVGFKYFWSPRDKTFLHPGVFVFLSPEGRVSRYLYSNNSRPLDVELALTDSFAERLTPGDAVNYAVSLCYSYNYKDGRYVLNIPLFVGVGSLTLGITVFAFSVFVYRRRARGEVLR